jgi:hypothetical protein
VIRGSRFAEVSHIRIGGIEAVFQHHHIHKDGLRSEIVATHLSKSLPEKNCAG